MARAIVDPAAVGYLVSDEQLAALARDYINGQSIVGGVRSSYLRILIAHAQKLAADKPRVTPRQAKRAVQQVHDHLYNVILDAVSTPDIAPKDDLEPDERSRRARERNRRSNFARTAKSTLDAWLTAGGKLKDLNPLEVTKQQLRAGIQPKMEGPERLIRSGERSVTRITNLMTRLAEVDKPAAQQLVSDLLEKLGPIVAKPLTRQSMKRGEMVLHPHP